MHVNIRSLGNKVFEVKNIVKEHNPHIIGVSECELRKIAGVYDETRLKCQDTELYFQSLGKYMALQGLLCMLEIHLNVSSWVIWNMIYSSLFGLRVELNMENKCCLGMLT